MDMNTKGTLIRTCLAILSAAGFFVFLLPVFTGILNIGNAAGMVACTVVFFLSLFWNKLFPIISENKTLRMISVAVTFLAVALLIIASVISAVMISAMNNTPPENTTVIILGCKVRGETPSLMLKKRIMSACDYLKDNPDSMCIVSGGQGSDEMISEAECMKRVLVENGISESRIIMEDKSTSTDENIRFSMEKMREYNLSGGVAVATSEFHQLRAKMIADSYNLTTYSIPAPTVWYLLPTYWLREWFGVTYQFLFK